MRIAIINAAKSYHQLALSSLVGLCLNRFKTFTNLFKENPKSVVPCLFTLQEGEVFQIPLEELALLDAARLKREQV